MVPGGIHPLSTTALVTLLQYQFVESRELDRRSCKLTKVAGMGLPHSGEIADGAFEAVAEDPWATDHRTPKQHGIGGFWRFKDDHHDPGIGYATLKLIGKIAAFFTVQCEAWNASKIELSEVVAKKNVHKGCFKTMPKYREFQKQQTTRFSQSPLLSAALHTHTHT